MKKVVYALLALGFVAALPAEANAAACARGPYRAGCAGPRGAVVTNRGYAHPYGGYARPYGHPYYRPAYGPHCYWRAGMKVCR